MTASRPLPARPDAAPDEPGPHAGLIGEELIVLAIRDNGPKAQDLDARFDWTLEGGESQRLTLSDGTLNLRPGSRGLLRRLVLSPEAFEPLFNFVEP